MSLGSLLMFFSHITYVQVVQSDESDKLSESFDYTNEVTFLRLCCGYLHKNVCRLQSFGDNIDRDYINSLIYKATEKQRRTDMYEPYL